MGKCAQCTILRSNVAGDAAALNFIAWRSKLFRGEEVFLDGVDHIILRADDDDVATVCLVDTS